MTIRIPSKKFIDELGELASSVGTMAFYPRMLKLLRQIVECDLGLVMRYSKQDIPSYIESSEAPNVITDLYQSGYYRLDPYYNYWLKQGKGGVLTIRQAAASTAEAKEYFGFFQPRTRMADDIGCFLPLMGGAAVGLFIERKSRFSTREVNKIKAMYPAFLGLHKAHQRNLILSLGQGAPSVRDNLLPKAFLIVDREGKAVHQSNHWKRQIKGEGIEPFISSLKNSELDSIATPLGQLTMEILDEQFVLAPEGSMFTLNDEHQGLPPLPFQLAIEGFLVEQLTEREHQIVKLILAGYPSSKIAEKLAISVGTVKNHRKRLYYKLDITTERELFLQFLAYLSGHNENNNI